MPSAFTLESSTGKSAPRLARVHPASKVQIQGNAAAMRLKGGSPETSAAGAGGDQHRHAVLAQQLGLGSHAYVLPLLYSMLAGLSTGIGGLLCLLMRGNEAMEVPVTAFMLATAAAAMITVSIVDLFMHIAEEIGLGHTLMMSISGAIAVIIAKKIGSAMFKSKDASGESAEESKKMKSERRLLRVGLLTAVTLTAHNLPEGMAVAISTMGSVNLGLKLAVAIALHNIPEGLAIACPLIMSKRYSPPAAIGIAFASGLSEPVGALLTLLVLQNIITQVAPPLAVWLAPLLQLSAGVRTCATHLRLLPAKQKRHSCLPPAHREGGRPTPLSLPHCRSRAWLLFLLGHVQERIDYALAFVGGVMMAVASLELMPEALRLHRCQEPQTVNGLLHKSNPASYT